MVLETAIRASIHKLGTGHGFISHRAVWDGSAIPLCTPGKRWNPVSQDWVAVKGSLKFHSPGVRTPSLQEHAVKLPFLLTELEGVCCPLWEVLWY